MTDPGRPGSDEYFDYFGRYVDQVPDGPVLETLESSLGATVGLLEGVPPELEEHRYAPEKWTVRQVVGHVLDVERSFGYRGLFIARGESTPLPSFDENLWARTGGHGSRPLAELVSELELVRRSHLLLFRALPREAWDRRGVVSGREFTVRAFPWIMAGHEIHHRRILEERYVPAGGGSA